MALVLRQQPSLLRANSTCSLSSRASASLSNGPETATTTATTKAFVSPAHRARPLGRGRYTAQQPRMVLRGRSRHGMAWSHAAMGHLGSMQHVLQCIAPHAALNTIAICLGNNGACLVRSKAGAMGRAAGAAAAVRAARIWAHPARNAHLWLGRLASSHPARVRLRHAQLQAHPALVHGLHNGARQPVAARQAARQRNPRLRSAQAAAACVARVLQPLARARARGQRLCS